MAKLSTDSLERALQLLGERLELQSSQPFGLVVSGGSALLALNLIQRSTRDVDVLGRYFSDKEVIVDPRPLPDELLAAAKDVQRALSLPENWLNTGPSDQLKTGVPDGFDSRLVRKDYGLCLTVYYVSRFDQIHFKLYAACDQGPGKHLMDLLELKPTEGEILTASRWVLQQDDSPGFRGQYLDMLKQLGYERIISQLTF
ncbi:MAG: hypothetical protein LBH01_02385 [Verrucomicrobiales bacterium]|jgi:hypothetical protein|nr:hypothetical protein [Verrucomicrobiales bacterium]